MACDLQCGGTRQSASSEEAKECVPSPQPGLLRGAYCPGYAPRIPCRRPRPNHSGVTPGEQGIHMTQNLYYSVAIPHLKNTQEASIPAETDFNHIASYDE